jgi:hypothetical protein
MSKKKKQTTERDALWDEAKRRCGLSTEDVKIAKEMGLNPRSLIKNIPSKSEPWKAPVKYWLREMYRKRQEKAAKKKAAREEEKERPPEDGAAATDVEQPAASSIVHADFLSPQHEEPPLADNSLESLDDLDAEFHELEQRLRDEDEPPDEEEIADENRMMWRRQQEFRIAAEYVAAAFGRLPEVEKVVLFGSVALSLKKEVPRFRKFRRAGVPVWHECRDVDLAVWLTDLRCLSALRRAKVQAIKELLWERDIGVADHQIDVFIVERGTDRYLGKLCRFHECPRGKPECDVPGCGATPFLKQYDDFFFDPRGLQPERVVVLFDRGGTGDSNAAGDEIPF